MGRGSNGTLITQQKALLHQENAVTKLTMEISRKGPSKAGHLLWKRAVPLMLLAIFLFWLISYTIYIIFPESHAIVLYLHWVKYPFLTSLTNLAAFELHHHARNIIIRTEDHHHVKGWHIVPLQHAWRVNASIAEADRDALFNSLLSDPSVSSRVIIYFHGNTATRGVEYRVAKYKILASHFKSHVVVVDYRGFGDSSGWPTEEGIFRDAIATVRWVQEHLNYTGSPSCANNSTGSDSGEEVNSCFNVGGERKKVHVYLYGQSLGTAIAIRTASEMSRQGTPPDGLIIDAGFTNMSDASRAHPIGAPFLSLPLLKQLVNERVGKLWLSTKHLLEVRCPILIFHGKRDIILPHLFGRTLYETFSSIGHGLYCKYVEIEKAGHNNIYRFQEWVHELEHFFLSRESSISSSSNSAPPFRGKPRSLKEKGGVK